MTRVSSQTRKIVTLHNKQHIYTKDNNETWKQEFKFYQQKNKQTKREEEKLQEEEVKVMKIIIKEAKEAKIEV